MAIRTALPLRKPHRLKGHDYASAGAYFVTFCTADMKCFLSNVEADGTLILGIAGKIVDEEIRETEVLREDFTLIEYCVMPNHVHILYTLNGELAEGKPNAFKDKVSGSAGTIVGALKSAVTRRMRKHYSNPDLELWHEKFHDHVVRDQADFDRIREYIINNPGQWLEDRYHPDVIARAQLEAERKMLESSRWHSSHAQEFNSP